ncbi:hypothetical protein [Candidatus Odyssella acanthamoebae]|uniref:Uncharacterized protein n=1 Tax=Candidatus Odyssella acanthamoebae TaxID=91604 RepID=A0A077AX42_9PROT|nr:hypothetical protein [Candidatus Paracaedibacter acanthamoebae]AIK96188.1 hypothetical protein ID47_04665 [Candidatus Paracaedibacter acanthamoebae]
MKIQYSNSVKKNIFLVAMASLMGGTTLDAMDAEGSFSTHNPSQQFIGNYGEKAHKKFQQMTPQIIDGVFQFLTTELTKPSKPDIQDLVDFVGQKRAGVATKVRSKNEKLFGKSRRFKDGYRGCGDLTPLYPDTYPTWRSQLSDHLTPILQEMSKEGTATKEIFYPPSKPRSKLSISIQPFSAYDLTHLEKENCKTNPSAEQFQKLADHMAIFDKKVLEIEASVWGAEEAKRRGLEMHAQWENAYAIKAAFFLKMGDSFAPTSSVFMRYLKDNSSQHPQGLSSAIVENLMREGAMIYQHTLQTHLPTIEVALGQYYKLILEWQPNDKKFPEQNEKSLLTLLGGFHYIFDHLMPYQRGRAAGAEWATQALGRLKGYELRLDKEVTSVVQEDLSQPSFPEFIKWYQSNVFLKKFH